jgi:hypothetical protein
LGRRRKEDENNKKRKDRYDTRLHLPTISDISSDIGRDRIDGRRRRRTIGRSRTIIYENEVND